MKTSLLFRRLASWQLAAVLTLAAGAGFTAHVAAAPIFTSVNNDSDILGVARETDPLCVNPWGLVTGTEGALHVADNGAGVATLYGPDGNLVAFTGTDHSITIPSVSGGETIGAPTGAAENLVAILTSDSNDFVITNGTSSGPAHYLYCTEDGAVTGYREGVDSSSAVVGPNDANQFSAGAGYTGMALSWVPNPTAGASPALLHQLYVANFLQGKIDVFDHTFSLVTLSSTSNFTDPSPPPVPVVGTTWSPFNIHHLDYTGRPEANQIGVQRLLLVTYALHTAGAPLNDVPGVGNGFVDIFTPEGAFVERFIDAGQGDVLNSPWGIAVAHTSLAGFPAPIVVLVGNHGDGQINAYGFFPRHPLVTNAHLGTLVKDGKGTPLAFDGLWTLHFGPKKTTKAEYNSFLMNPADLAEDEHNLYFSAGIVNETHGLVGRIIVP